MVSEQYGCSSKCNNNYREQNDKLKFQITKIKYSFQLSNFPIVL